MSGGSDSVAMVGNFVSDGRRFAPGLGMGCYCLESGDLFRPKRGYVQRM